MECGSAAGSTSVRSTKSNPTGDSNFRIDEVSGNRLGFIGTETLSKDLWAFYRLEHRFHLDDGTERSGRHNGTQFWTDKAWVGIGSKTYGALSAGRIPDRGELDRRRRRRRAMTDSIGATNSRKGRIENNLDNGLFYESPWFQPGKGMKLRVKAHYALAEVDGIQNPYGLGVQWRSGKFLLDTGYQHDVYKDGSDPSKEDRKSNSGSWARAAISTASSSRAPSRPRGAMRVTSATTPLPHENRSGQSEQGLRAVAARRDDRPQDRNQHQRHEAAEPRQGSGGLLVQLQQEHHADADHRLRAQIRVGIQGQQQRLRRDKDKSGNLYLQLGLRHEF